MKFLNKLKNRMTKVNPYTFLLSDPENPYTIETFTNTECYVLNAFLSDGDIFKGLPDGKRVMIAGESSTGKSLISCYMIKSYLDKHPDATCVILESETAGIVLMAKSIGIDMSRVIILPVSTVEDAEIQLSSILDSVIEENGKTENQARLIVVIDSLGMLSTNAELANAESGEVKADVGRRNLALKRLSRTTTMKINMAKVPVIVVNHVYANISGYGPKSIISGGGIHYMQDIMMVTSTVKEKNSAKEQIGIIMNVRMHKSRFMQENKNIKININAKTGLDKWSDIVTLAQKYDIIEKVGTNMFLISHPENQNIMFVNTITTESQLKKLIVDLECDKAKIIKNWNKSNKDKSYKYRTENRLFDHTDAQTLITNGILMKDERVKMKLVKKYPEKYISDELLAKIGEAIQADFSFGVITDEGEDECQ